MNSFLLKDKDGRVRGYLLRTGEEICCRLSVTYRDAELFVYEQQNGVCFHLTASDGEQRFLYRNVEIRCAVVFSLGQMVLASDWVYADALPQTGAAEKKEKEKEEEKEKKQSSLVLSENKPLKGEEEQPPRLWPQRRWPPPPCLMGARYHGGQWRMPSGNGRSYESGTPGGDAVPCVDV